MRVQPRSGDEGCARARTAARGLAASLGDSAGRRRARRPLLAALGLLGAALVAGAGGRGAPGGVLASYGAGLPASARAGSVTGTSSGSGTSTGSATGTGSATTTGAATSSTTATTAYDVVESDGYVTPLGGSGYYGSPDSLVLAAPIVGMAVTPDGKGYWLVGADGGIFSFGDAAFYGSVPGILEDLCRAQGLPPGCPEHRLAAPIVGMAATPDGKGYWLVAADGGIFAFGDAAFYGSMGGKHLNAPIVGMAADPTGTGYWLVAADGGIFSFGHLHFYGSMGGEHLNAPIVGMAADPTGTGYWLVAADGGIFSFGQLHFYGSMGGSPLSSPIVGMAADPTGTGYWLVAADGGIFAFGSAPFAGSLAGAPQPSPTKAIVAARPVLDPPPPPYPAGTVGYDVSWPQCETPSSPIAGPLPSGSFTVAVLGVDGWADGSSATATDNLNPCLAAEVAWARSARTPSGAPAPYDLYLFLNSPEPSSTIDATGPAGTCASDPSGSSAWQRCLAYNFGFNSARDALSYAASQGATARTWWLDVESSGSCSPSTGNFDGGWGFAPFWSCDTSLNDLTIQGAIDALRIAGLDVGIYSTSLQWAEITGSYVPPGAPIPLWVAGAPWTSPPYPASYGYESPSNLGPWCAGTATYAGTDFTDAFAGGVPTLLQETPGANNYPYDPDYAC